MWLGTRLPFLVIPTQVGIIAVDDVADTPRVVDALSRTGDHSVIPVCSDTLIQLESFVTSYTPDADTSLSASYSGGFQAAFDLFTAAADTGQSSSVRVWR